MNSVLNAQLAQSLAADRQREAQAHARARRVAAVRRWQRRKEVADRQVRLARLAVR